MLPKQLKDSQRHQRQPKQVELFLQSSLALPYHITNHTSALICPPLYKLFIFVVILQFVNCSQLPTIQAPLSAYSCDQLWLTLLLLTLTTFWLPTSYLHPKFRTWSKCEGATHKLKPSPSIINSDLQHTTCYDFEQLSDNRLYSCLVLGKLSIVNSCLLWF